MPPCFFHLQRSSPLRKRLRPENQPTRVPQELRSRQRKHLHTPLNPLHLHLQTQKFPQQRRLVLPAVIQLTLDPYSHKRVKRVSCLGSQIRVESTNLTVHLRSSIWKLRFYSFRESAQLRKCQIYFLPIVELLIRQPFKDVHLCFPDDYPMRISRALHDGR